jgi:hypothetical protein
MSTQRIESKPTEALSYSPVEAKYWDRTGLGKELERVLRHPPRLPALLRPMPLFPALFDAIDKHGEDIRILTKEETWRVVDLCYGCKLCR